MAKGYTTGKMYDLPITDITVGSWQTRSYFDDQAMQELILSVKKHGVLLPVLVQAAEAGKFLLVAGERRYRAAQTAGLTTIPAVLTDGDAQEISLVENLLRAGLTVIEEAESLEALKTSHNYQLSDLSGIFGFSDSTLSEILSLNKLPKAVKDDCRTDSKASRSTLVEIAKQRTEAKMLALYDKYKKKGLTRDELRLAAPRMARQDDGPADVSFIANFLKRLDTLDPGKVPQDQHDSVVETLEKIRSSAFHKLKALKITQPQPPQAAQ